jgi:TetR/AcrR family transcriptional regulator, regulator of cefoperazone and chloramphenicol sensitivity
VKKAAKPGRSRTVLTKDKLLEVAIDAFANAGYEGVGTRELAERAGANLSAIRYHFGNKEGLYRAVIQHISQGVQERVSPFIQHIRSRAERPNVSREELIDFVCQLITAFAAQLLASGIGDNWARLVVREQMKPTKAFDVMYNVFRLLLDGIAPIVAKIVGEPPESEEVRICAMTLVGQALVFRTHRATALKFIGWKKLGPKEISELQSVLSKQCDAILTMRSQ